MGTSRRGRDPTTACDGKVSFGTWAAARHNARWMNRVNREKASGKRVHVYQCPHCGGIHVGGDTPRRKPR